MWLERLASQRSPRPTRIHFHLSDGELDFRPLARCDDSRPARAAAKETKSHAPFSAESRGAPRRRRDTMHVHESRHSRALRRRFSERIAAERSQEPACEPERLRFGRITSFRPTMAESAWGKPRWPRLANLRCQAALSRNRCSADGSVSRTKMHDCFSESWCLFEWRPSNA